MPFIKWFSSIVKFMYFIRLLIYFKRLKVQHLTFHFRIILIKSFPFVRRLNLLAVLPIMRV